MKSDRLKKLESEIYDLEQWMKLGLVPKKEIDRHKQEIETLKERVIEEKERLQFIKESGDAEEFTIQKRGPGKTVYAETPSMSDVGFGESTEAGLEMETEATDLQTKEEDKEDTSTSAGVEQADEDEEDPFSDKNRWRRGGIIDPDATEW